MIGDAATTTSGSAADSWKLRLLATAAGRQDDDTFFNSFVGRLDTI